MKYLPMILIIFSLFLFVFASRTFASSLLAQSTTPDQTQSTDPNAVFNPAQQSNQPITDFNTVSSTPTGFVQDIYGIGTGFVGMTALLFFMYGGYFVLTSRGDPEQLNKGKSYMFYSILGILLALFGFVIFEIITTGVFHLPGFS